MPESSGISRTRSRRIRSSSFTRTTLWWPSSRTWAPSRACSTPASTRRSGRMTNVITNIVQVVIPSMTDVITNIIPVVTPPFEGYVYPNEATQEPLWSILIVLYPYITGLVAGAFIMASLVRVFKVKALEPVYRLSLLTALAFLLCATLPLLFHLGHPERCYEIMITPHLTSPMAIFGFVYAWYLMAVLLLELWFDYRQDFVEWSKTEKGLLGIMYRAL